MIALRTGERSELLVKIRSVTLFVPSVGEDESEPRMPIRPFFDKARNRFREAGAEVQTTRIALPPLSRALQARRGRSITDHARRAEELCRESGAGYVSLGTIELGDDVEARGPALAEALADTELVFASIETARDGRLSREACATAAAVMAALAALTDQGFGNLRFAAIAHCPSGIPFFPAAYGDGSRPGFALALEAADVAVAAIRQAGMERDPADAFAEALERAILPVERAALGLQEELGIAYLGADLSPAPFPGDACSIGRAIELASGVPFGAPGTLVAAAILTRAIRSARVRRCGFSGLMLPVLEDSTLALRSAEGRLTVDELLLHSSVCGTGLDTVPLPGDATTAELAAIVGDVAALSAALRKPLTARLFPVPGKKAGDAVAYDFPYFAAGAAVLPIRS
jgi:uncharacterized protein (UPF0210 family)